MYKIHHLDGALNNWEDMNMLLHALALAQEALNGRSIVSPLDSSLCNWSSFRQYLLDSKKSNRFVHEQYMSSNAELIQRFNFLWEVPHILYQWTKKSRRVYHLENSVLDFLEVTSLCDLKWGGVYLPFDSYAITLERPYRFMNDIEIDCMLFSRIKEDESDPDEEVRYNFHLFSRKEYVGLDDRTKYRLRKLIEEKNWKEVYRFASKKLETIASKKRAIYHATFDEAEEVLREHRVCDGLKDVMFKDRETDSRITFLKVDVTDEFWKMVNYFAKLFAGFSVYLELGMQNNNQSFFEKQRVIKKKKIREEASVNGITQEGDVCFVKSLIEISSFEKKIHANGGKVPENIIPRAIRKAAGYYVIPRHVRRPPGKGNDPTYPKIVHVRPYEVNVDKLPPGTLPGGSLTKYK
ncbi:hypothetical protein ISS03_04670 [Patescibacteria group bacterium]|nr:hypothetical protein [Patescibacteria group bacterium]